ncbi:hypothetical protein DRW48_07690 [Paracoccus suum]|uniref:Uncharacterized protein n=1 Tax=Paracoccus suum TaxID=2259340 RepID=A0A344PJN3_9RHOB|nr:hypothetical protein [Paracoccus suum]AXC49588.1 hypothetical protein DRW48_07690 [Paracoccus suum]
MNLDFGFLDDAGRLVLAGWDAEAGPLNLQVEDAEGKRQPVTVLARFARGDLGTEAALGILAVASPGSMPAALLAGDTRTVLDAEAIADGANALISACLDETFAALLRAIAMGQIGPLPADAVARLVDRTRATAAPLPAHYTRIAAAADKAMVAPGGHGFVLGWVLTDDAADAPLVGLVGDGTSLVPVAINTGSIERADLAGYGERYSLTGADGYQAVFRLPSANNRPAQLILLPRDGAHGFGLMTTPLVRAPGTVVTASLAAGLRGLPRDAARALLARLAPRPGRELAPLPQVTDTRAGSALLLIPDTEPRELRDIPRWLLPHLPPPVTVVPLSDALPAAAAAALRAALAEGRGDGTLTPPCAAADLPDLHLPPGTEVAAGSAAALFQLGLPPAAPNMAAALVHNPLGALSAETELRAADLAGLPFTLRLSSDLLGPALAALPRGLLSAEGSLAIAATSLAAAGRLEIATAATTEFWPGRYSGIAAARIDAALQAAP